MIDLGLNLLQDRTRNVKNLNFRLFLGKKFVNRKCINYVLFSRKIPLVLKGSWPRKIICIAFKMYGNDGGLRTSFLLFVYVQGFAKTVYVLKIHKLKEPKMVMNTTLNSWRAKVTLKKSFNKQSRKEILECILACTRFKAGKSLHHRHSALSPRDQ